MAVPVTGCSSLVDKMHVIFFVPVSAACMLCSCLYRPLGRTTVVPQGQSSSSSCLAEFVFDEFVSLPDGIAFIFEEPALCLLQDLIHDIFVVAALGKAYAGDDKVHAPPHGAVHRAPFFPISVAVAEVEGRFDV